MLQRPKLLKPAITGIASYLRQDLRADTLCGLTVAVMGVPQAMAYALIAGLPPVYGLYTAIVTCSVAAIFGSSNHLVTGPTNALCMVILSLTATLPQKYGLDLLEIIFLLTFMSGFIQFLLGLFRLGGIVRYVSNSVVIGFTAGAGILIAVNQLKNILGIDISTAHAERLYEVLMATVWKLPETNPFALLVGVLTASAVVLIPRMNAKLPAALIAVVGTSVLSFLLGWHEPSMEHFRIGIVRDIEPIRGTLGIFHLPELVLHARFELVRELGTGAVALAILGLIEAASISRAVAASSGQRLDFTREFVGQGAGNLVGSFFSCFCGSGSFTRTALCYKSGGHTRMAAVFSAVWTALTLLFLAPLANFIPKASLAGILVIIAYSMIDKHRLGLTWRSGKNSRIVLFGTLVSTLILPLEYAIFAGIFLSIVILLKVTGQTDLTQLVPRHDSGFDEVPFNRAAPSPVVTVNMEGDLYFAAVEDLDYELLRCLTSETYVVVLRMKRLRAVGSTAMAMLEHFWTILRERHVTLIVSGIEEEMEEVMTGSGLRKQIGEQNIFFADNKLFQSTELALARAWSIVETERAQAVALSGGERSAQRQEFSAATVMSRRSIRFGNQHQLREAVWLLSEMLRRTRDPITQPLFLQDREGKLAGELTTWHVLEELTRDIELSSSGDLRDLDIGVRMRSNFTQSIEVIARSDVVGLKPDASLAELVATTVENDFTIVPICDPESRIMGLVSARDVLRGLAKMFNLVTRNEPHG